MGSDQKKITTEAVISKLKDDGDFDRLRLKIIRQLKQNEGLRSDITSVVKECTALNCASAKNMKPRQLCDAIHAEVCEKVMNQISDALWEIIRSGDGMQTEITETVRSVYSLLNQEGKSGDKSPPVSAQASASRGAESSGSVMVSGENNDGSSNGKREDPSGFTLHNDTGSADEGSQSETPQPGASARKSEDQGKKTCQSNGSLQLEDGDRNPPPGFSSLMKQKSSLNGSDEDPDIPPGFG